MSDAALLRAFVDGLVAGGRPRRRRMPRLEIDAARPRAPRERRHPRPGAPGRTGRQILRARHREDRPPARGRSVCRARRSVNFAPAVVEAIPRSGAGSSCSPPTGLLSCATGARPRPSTRRDSTVRPGKWYAELPVHRAGSALAEQALSAGRCRACRRNRGRGAGRPGPDQPALSSVTAAGRSIGTRPGGADSTAHPGGGGSPAAERRRPRSARGVRLAGQPPAADRGKVGPIDRIAEPRPPSQRLAEAAAAPIVADGRGPTCVWGHTIGPEWSPAAPTRASARDRHPPVAARHPDGGDAHPEADRDPAPAAATGAIWSTTTAAGTCHRSCR